jgi:hypothetical protein
MSATMLFFTCLVILASALSQAIKPDECRDCIKYCKCLPELPVDAALKKMAQGHKQCSQMAHEKARKASSKQLTPGLPQDFVRSRKKYEMCMKKAGFPVDAKPQKKCPKCTKDDDGPFFGRKKRSLESYLDRIKRQAELPIMAKPLSGSGRPASPQASFIASQTTFRKAMSECLAKKKLPPLENEKWRTIFQTISRARGPEYFRKLHECHVFHCEKDPQLIADFKCSEKHFTRLPALIKPVSLRASAASKPPK